ncbi:TrmH family RNA methyltransferase [Oceanobacillus sp. CAU 1775]
MITSIKNEKVKAWKKLHKRKGRNDASAFLIEGLHLVEEAWKNNVEIIEIIMEEFTEVPEWANDYSVEIVSKQVFQEVSQTTTPQGIAAVLSIPEEEQLIGNHILLIDRIQDPGNLGTIIRTADAAGIDAVILGEGTVDLYNDKVIRATQGSLFHVPIYTADLGEKIATLKEEGFEIWATALEDATRYQDLAIPKKVAVLLGNEGAGVDSQLLNTADKRVTIPIYGKAESLNVAIAAGILMYHLKN